MDPISDVRKYVRNYTNDIPSYNSISSMSRAKKDTSSNQHNFSQKPQINEGEIIAIKKNEISIRLKDNTIIKAKLYNTKSFEVGQSVYFKLKETSTGNVIEYIKAKESDTEIMIKRALEGAKLPPSESNKDLVKKLLANNLSVDKQTLYKILQESHANKSSSIDSLIIMQKHNIPFSKNNINQFEKYCNYEHRIIKELDTISCDISKLIQEYAKGATPKKLLAFNHELVKIICSTTDSHPNDIDISSVFSSPDDSHTLVSLLSKYNVSTDLLNSIKSGRASLLSVSVAIKNCLEKADEIDNYKLLDTTDNVDIQKSLEKEAFNIPLINTILDVNEQIQRDSSNISSFMNDYNKAILISKLRDFEGSVSLSDKIWSGNISSCDLLKELDEMFLDYSNRAQNNDFSNFKTRKSIDSYKKGNNANEIYSLLLNKSITDKNQIFRQLFANHNIKIGYKEILDCFSKFASSEELLTIEKALTEPNTILSNNELNVMHDLYHNIAHYKKEFLLQLKKVFAENNHKISLTDTEMLNKILSDEITQDSSAYYLTPKRELVHTAIKKVLVCPQYTDIIKETLLNKWTISPNELKNPEVIKKTYEKIYKELNKLNNFVERMSNGLGVEKITANIQNTKSNIDFMSTLNNLFGYVQLPIKLRNQNIHSDLYVLTNKKRIKENPKRINVLLHLDLSYLGSLDVNIMLDNKQVTTKFLVSDNTIKALLDTNINQLEMDLLEKGYLLNSDISLKKDEIDLVKDFIEKDSPTTSLKRYSFDIRT